MSIEFDDVITGIGETLSDWPDRMDAMRIVRTELLPKVDVDKIDIFMTELIEYSMDSCNWSVDDLMEIADLVDRKITIGVEPK